MLYDISVIAGIIIIVSIIVIIYTNSVPQFGQKPRGEDLEQIKRSANYRNNKFVNQMKTGMPSFRDMMKTLPEFIKSKNGKPESPLKVKFSQNHLPLAAGLCYITWFGHSAFLIEQEGKRMLFDPMLTGVSSPFSFGTKRFPYEKPIPVAALTDIDAVILTHDHYDHLDYHSIMLLKDKVKHYFTPLGVGSHLKKWGISADKITELDWWQEAQFMGMTLVSCPSRHFSGRGLTDRDATLWSGWVIMGNQTNLYYSGDGGYGPHFREVGKKFGPFDLALMECGQYNKAWENIHMMPEQSVQAGIDAKGKILMPVHWGAFKLSTHSWTDPITRFKAESERLNIPIVHPMIGERITPGQEMPNGVWWEN